MCSGLCSGVFGRNVFGNTSVRGTQCSSLCLCTGLCSGTTVTVFGGPVFGVRVAVFGARPACILYTSVRRTSKIVSIVTILSIVSIISISS